MPAEKILSVGDIKSKLAKFQQGYVMLDLRVFFMVSVLCTVDSACTIKMDEGSIQ